MAGGGSAVSTGSEGGNGVVATGEQREGAVGSEDSAGGTQGDRQEVEDNLLNKLQAQELISFMEQNADVAPSVELTAENWDRLFGADGIVNTPLGKVKMGENQFTKLMREGRLGKLGMIKPTLEAPDVVVEEESKAKEGDVTERGSSYIYIKAFRKPDGSRYYYFTSVTISKAGHEVIISNQEKRKSVIMNLLLNSKMVWKHADNVSSVSDVTDGLYSSQGNLSDPTTEGTDAPQTNIVSFAGKDSERIDAKQESEQENDDVLYRDGEERSLLGVHNITAEKLAKVLKQGGLANPSVAVVDIDVRLHDDFGEISLIAPSAKIDRRRGKNAGTFEGDAWTPTYPAIERQTDETGSEQMNADIAAVPVEMQSDVRRALNGWLDNGAVDRLAYLYLHQRGKAPDIVLMSPKYDDAVAGRLAGIMNGRDNVYSLSKEELQQVVDLYVEVELKGDIEAFKANTEKQIAKYRKGIANEKSTSMRYKIAEQRLKEVEAYGYPMGSISQFVVDVERSAKAQGNANTTATENAAKDIVKAEGLENDFRQWVESLNERYGIKEVIFDGYTASGNRRYVPNTLENVSKLMKKEGRNAATGLGISFSNFAASVMKAHGRLDDIKKKKGKLTVTKEAIEEFDKKWEKVFFDLGLKLQPGATRFEDYGLWRLQEAATQSDPRAYLAKEYGIELSEADRQKLSDMIKAIQEERPAVYFETKFERPVGLDEFVGAVVPKGTDERLVEGLRKAGLQVAEYGEGEREVVTRGFLEELDKGGDVLFRDDETIERLVERLKQTALAKEVVIDQDAFDKKLAEIEGKYGSDAVEDVVEDAENARFRIGNKRKEEMRAMLVKKRPDLVERGEVEATINAIEAFGEEEAGEKGDSKLEKLALHWTVKSGIRLPEDGYAVRQAAKIATIKGVDPMSFDNPKEIIDKYAGEVKGERLDPDKEPMFGDRQGVPGTGIVTYSVDNSYEGQAAVRRMIDTHWGKDANPWCLAARIDGSLERAKQYWRHYDAYPKRIAFKDGKLLAFSANDRKNVVWWDRQDDSHDGIPAMIRLSEGRRQAVVYDTNGEIIEKGYIEQGNEENGLYRRWDENGQLLVEANYKDGKEDGIYRSWNANGQLKKEANYKDGKRHGLYRGWHSNGQLMVEANYKDGKEHGIYRSWYESGQLMGEATFKDGMRNGLYRRWHENGQLMGEATFKDDKENGLYRSWDEDGQLMVEATYKDGELDGLSREWDEDGQLMVEATYEDGKVDGLYRKWHSNGQLKEEATYKDGKLHGISRKWYKGGELWVEATYKDGKEDGLSREWYKGGELRKEANYKDGMRNGLYRKWHSNGELMEESTYEDGELDGLSREWDEDGQLMVEATYKDGELDGLYRKWYESGQLMEEANYEDGKHKDISRWWFENGELMGEVRYLSTSSGDVYGFVVAGVVYLNPSKLDVNTPIHEFAHLWNDVVRRVNPKLWAEGKRLVMSSAYWDAVNSNSAYAHLSDDGKVDEALAMAIADRGERSIDLYGIPVAIMRSWVQKVWSAIKAFFGVRSDMSIERFSDMALSDLLGGKSLVAGIGGVHDDKIAFQVRNGEDEVNEQFNDALQKQIDGVLPKGYVYNLGMPNDILHSAGIPNLPIELVASRLSDKAMQENHPFDLGEVKDLPHAIQNPLAVFRSATHIGSNVILTNLKHGGRNYVVAVETNRRAGKIYVNSVRSVHYRNSLNVIGWINDGLVDYISDEFRNHWVEEKKNELLSKPQYNSVDVRKKLISATKIVKDFVNPSIGGEYLSRQGNNASQGADEYTEEEQAIIDKAKANANYMKAPNGEPTNLDEKQWVQVRTKAFKDWFGDWENVDASSSTLTDENGEPKVFYHNTDNEFSVFDANRNGTKTDAGWLGDGFYFYGDVSEGAGYGHKKMAVFLNVREPYYASSEENEELAEANSRTSSIEFRDNIESEGYDGVYYNGDFRQEVVVFYPNQIKSAVDNNGGFDPYNEDIRYKGNGKQNKMRNKRERAVMRERVEALAEKLGLDNVEVLEDGSSLEGRAARAKGFYSKRSGKITIVLGNHARESDVVETLLHEAVAHYGLRKLFGVHFDTFLDNVFRNADEAVRDAIVRLAPKYGWDFRIATEEYLAGLAEKTNFEKMPHGFWVKVKQLFLDMLHKIGFDGFGGVELGDNELRYILWRSYENMVEPGSLGSILGEAEDISKRTELGVGGYAGNVGDDLLFSGRDLRYNSGYTTRDDGSWLSVRADKAEQEGKYTEGKFRTQYKVGKKDFALLKMLGLVESNEWHHTGQTFAEKDFYEWSDHSEREYSAEDLTPAGSLAARYQEKKKEITALVKAYEGAEWEHEPLRKKLKEIGKRGL